MDDEVRRARQLGIKARKLRAEAHAATAERDALVYKLIAGKTCTQAELSRQLELTREQVRRIYDTEQLRRAREASTHDAGPG